MAYVHLRDNGSTLGYFACGPGCSCGPCRERAGLGERYIEEEDDDDEPVARPPPPPKAPPPPAPATNLRGWGGFGQAPFRRPRLAPPEGLQLRMPAFETLTGFVRGNASLNGAQLQRVNRVAEFIARSWTGASPIMSVRVTGYIDRDEWQPDLGQRRAAAVQDALMRALNSLRPGLATRLRWLTENRGLSSIAKVEIYLWAGATPPPVPPLVRIPSPAEVARRMVPMRPETPEERIQRILRTLPPAPPARRSFSQMFWQQVDERLNSVMNRLSVPGSLRGPIRDGVHAAIRRGSEALLNEIVGATGLPGGAQDAIRGTVKALLEVPIQ